MRRYHRGDAWDHVAQDDAPAARAVGPCCLNVGSLLDLEKSRPVAELVKTIALKYKATPSQVALNWLINFPGEIVVAIPGATKARHAEENTGAMKFRLSTEDMKLLDEISKGFKE